MRSSLYIIMLLLYQAAFTQNVTKKTICVKDAETFATIPFAIIKWDNGKNGLYCDSNGVVTLKDLVSDKQRFTASFLSYEIDTIPEFSLNKDTLYFFLLPKKITLPDFLIETKAAEHILAKAIRLIPSNYIKKPHSIEGYYRQLHTENDQYVRLIESVIDVLESGISTVQVFSHRFKILALRRSNNYEKNKEEHGDHLYDLFSENYIIHPKNSILDIHALNYFELYVDKTSEKELTIRYQEKDIGQDYLKNGMVIININDFAILEIHEKEVQNQNKINKREYTNGSYLWIKVIKDKSICFTKSEVGYSIKSISMYYQHNLKNNITGQIDYRLNEKFTFITSALNFSNKPLEVYSKTGNLYLFHYQMNDWEKWEKTYRTTFPLNDDVKTNLERVITLEKQFKSNE